MILCLTMDVCCNLALFYCMWMSDKPLVQQKLADDLADLVLVVRSSKTPSRIGRVNASLAFLEAFWAIVLREWSGLDRLRSVHELTINKSSCTRWLTFELILMRS